MASTASHPAAITVPQGVAPLRAGQGYSFLLRRLHSLSGIVPIGAFLIAGRSLSGEFEQLLIAGMVPDGVKMGIVFDP